MLKNKYAGRVTDQRWTTRPSTLSSSRSSGTTSHTSTCRTTADNNDYVDGKGFSETDGSLEGAMLKAARAQAKSGNKSAGLKNNFQQGDGYEKYQFFYHPDHLGSSSFITDTEGEVVQHIEYVPYGEVFIEERNNVWNSPYLFTFESGFKQTKVGRRNKNEKVW